MPSWLEIDPDIFAARFNAKPFYIRHRLTEHPLFTVERLMELSKSLPESFVEWRAGGLGLNHDDTRTPMNGLSPAETIRRIAENKSYLIMKWVETDPEYRRLLDECMDQIREHSEGRYPGMHKRAGFLFISSPGEVVPYHMDHEHNFLLQIRGAKTVRQWDPTDRFVLPDREIEEHYANGKGRYLEYKDAYAATAFVLPIQPGEGIHFPVCAPHWIENGGDVSISFSITFRSAWTRRRELLYHANARLRRLGLRPAAIGDNPLEDFVKHKAMQTASTLRRMTGAKQEEARRY